jgi:hypothetical protein
MTTAIGIEAKACEGFDGTVGDRAGAAAPSKKRARCNLLARALSDARSSMRTPAKYSTPI